MGVYILVYAPILIIVNMSLVIEKYSAGKPLYKRLSDDIDLDAYALAATTELNMKLPFIKDEKLRALVRNDFNRILEGMYKKTYTYMPGGGWSNNEGVSNDPLPVGFDSLGIAAGILGETLRALAVYNPKAGRDLIKYKGPQDVGNAIMKSLIGPTGLVQYFINKDPLGSNGKRGIDKRSALVLAELERYYNDDSAWDIFDITQDQIAEWRSLYDRYRGIFKDAKITPDEYLDLSLLLGKNADMEAMFFDGDKYVKTTIVDAAGNAALAADAAADPAAGVTPAADSTVPSLDSSGIFAGTSYSLGFKGKYSLKVRKDLDDIIKNANTTVLLNIVKLGILKSRSKMELNGADIIYDAFMKKYGKPSLFENSYILSRILEHLRNNGTLLLVPGYLNSFYIPLKSKTFDSLGVVPLYQISAGKSPEFTLVKKNLLPAMKHGGVIRKFQEGGTPGTVEKKRGILTADSARNNIFYTGDWGGYHNWHAHNIVNPWLAAYENPGSVDWEQYIIKGMNSWNDAGGFDWLEDDEETKFVSKLQTLLGVNVDGNFGKLTKKAVVEFQKKNGLNPDGVVGKETWTKLLATDPNNTLKPEDMPKLLFGSLDSLAGTDKRKHGLQSEGTKTHQQLIIDEYPGLNVEIGKLGTYYSYPANPSTDDRFINGVVKGTDNDFGIQTGNRRPTIHIGVEGDDLIAWEKFFKNLGYVGKYKYLDHWVPTKDANKVGLVAFGEYPEDPAKQDELSDLYKQLFGDGFRINEAFLPTPTSKAPNPWLSELVPGLMGVGRAAYAHHSDIDIYKTLRPSLKAPLENTWEEYSPVTGANSYMQLMKEQGARGLSDAWRTLTSDADLAVASQLEGLRLYNDGEGKGFLAHDNEIKRTSKEALDRVERGVKRRSDLWNKNSGTINKTNREIAELKAAKKKNIWNTWDQWLKGTEARAYKLADERRTRINDFYDSIDSNAANDWYNDVMKAANAELAAWEGDPTAWPKWQQYVNYKNRAKTMASAMLHLGMSDRYNLGYTNIYPEALYSMIRWT